MSTLLRKTTRPGTPTYQDMSVSRKSTAPTARRPVWLEGCARVSVALGRQSPTPPGFLHPSARQHCGHGHTRWGVDAGYLCSSCNHVLNVIGVARTVNVSVVPVGGLVLDVCGGNGDTTCLAMKATQPPH